MTGPKLVLPSLAMPWGRWTEDAESSTTSALSRLSQDSRSTSLGFEGRSQTIASQIEAIPSLAGIYQRDIPEFSVSRPSFVGTFRVWDSPVTTINPPQPDKAFTTSVIAVIRVTGVNLTFGRSYLRLNGVDTSFSHENSPPGGGAGDGATFSIMGTVDTDENQPVSVQFAVSGSSVGTATFAGCNLYAIFNGRIT